MEKYRVFNIISVMLMVIMSYGDAFRKYGTCPWSALETDCLKHEFQCSNGKCIPRSRFCNRNHDCGDASDEKYCYAYYIGPESGYQCSLDPPYMNCESSERCVPLKWFCDGIRDCPNGEDEKDCSKISTTIERKDVTTSVLNAIEWFHQQKKSDEYFTERWGSPVDKSAVALYLVDHKVTPISNESRQELPYEASIQLLHQISKTKLQNIPTTRLASFVNAFLMSCVNPRKFHGFDLVQELRTRVNRQNYTDPYVFLSLCNAGDTITESDKMKLIDTFWNKRRTFWTDVQALVVMALACASNQIGSNADTEILHELSMELKQHQYKNGTVESLQTTALVMQALLSVENGSDDFDEEKALKQIILGQKKDGSFGSLLTTYYVLPVLNCKSLVNVTANHCHFGRRYEISALESLAGRSGPKMRIRYSIWIGNEKNLETDLALRVPANTSFYGIMEIAAEIDSRYRFEYVVKDNKPYLNTLSGIPDDPDNGKFWFLYTVEDGKPSLTKQSPADIIPKENDHLVMWYRRGSWID